MNRINLTSEALSRVRRTILFIESSVMSMEMSKPLRKRLGLYLDGLKKDEEVIYTFLHSSGGIMSSNIKEDADDTQSDSIHA